MANQPSTAAASKVAKPMMRGLHNATIKRNLIAATVLTFVTTVAYKLLVNDPRKAAYAEFYKTYDAEKSFERMRANKRFQSC